MTYDKTSIAGRAIQAIHEKQIANAWLEPLSFPIDERDKFLIQKANEAIFKAEEKARIEEREKMAGEFQESKKESYRLREEIVMAQQETAKTIFSQLEKEQWHWDTNGLLVLDKRLYEIVKKRWNKQ